MPIPADEAHYAADRNVPGPGCGFRVFVRDETAWNWTREAACFNDEAKVAAWAADQGLKPVFLG